MMSIIVPTVAFASAEIKVAIDGKQVNFDVKPQLINDRTMVPLRFVAEALDVRVGWDNAQRAVFIME